MDPKRVSSYDVEHNIHRITLYSTVVRAHQHRSLRKRLYLHLDMNCFYAQVEQCAYNLYGLPLAMGAWRKPDGTPRGIVATASYEARALGIKTAMSAYEAHRICPYLIFMQIDYEKYKGISDQIGKILERYSPEVEKYSMDEYFLDVNFLKGKSHDAIRCFVQEMKQEMYRELGLVCSVGVATSKTYAKLASGLRKPNGLLVVLTHDDIAEYFFKLPLEKVWGIGSRRFAKLQAQGMHTIADAFKLGPAPFQRLFGKMQGALFHQIVTGNDRAKIMDVSQHIPDEVSYMHTFSDWSVDVALIQGEVVKAVRQVCYRLRGYHRKARKWGCHIRFQNEQWEGITFAINTPGFTNLDKYVLNELLPETERRVSLALRQGQKIRGIGLHTIEMAQVDQLELFFQEEDKLLQLNTAMDCLNNHYGLHTVATAALKETVPGKTHFVNRS